MRYHCAIRAVGVHFRKVKYTNSIFSYFVTLAVKMPIGRLLPMKFGNNVSKERDGAIAITLFHPSRSEFELRTFSGQFRKQEKQTKILNEPYIFDKTQHWRGHVPWKERGPLHTCFLRTQSAAVLSRLWYPLCVWCAKHCAGNTSTHAEGEATTSVVGQRCQ